MASLLTSELENDVVVEKIPLTVQACLGEFESESQKEMARTNLNVYGKNETYNIQNFNKKLQEAISEAFTNYLNEDDPHHILDRVKGILDNYMPIDGSKSFTHAQSGKDPIKDSDFTTKQYVLKLIQNHLDKHDPHEIVSEIKDILQKYIQKSEVYSKDQIYTKSEVNTKVGNLINRDGSIPFEKPQLGVDPKTDGHLTTKRYVDNKINDHKNEANPHNIITLLNSRLASYARANDVYTKESTYSRVQLDEIINQLIDEAVIIAIQKHLNDYDPHHILDEINKLHFIKQDGSVPFNQPQKGVDAIDNSDLVTLAQVNEKITTLENKIPEPAIWITSGPVETTVGFVEDNTLLPEKLTLQETLDAIFYGKRIKLNVDEFVKIGDIIPITICVQGSLENIQYIEIYQEDDCIGYITVEQLTESGCYTIDSLPITSDQNITAKVFYTNGTIYELNQNVKVSLPIFVGIIQRWKQGCTFTYELLKSFTIEDPENNKFYYEGKNVTLIEHNFNFDKDKEYKIVVAMPNNYSNLSEMSNSAQVVNQSAFDKVDMIPFLVPGSNDAIIYKIYTYKQDLYSLNTTMKFKFE